MHTRCTLVIFTDTVVNGLHESPQRQWDVHDLGLIQIHMTDPSLSASSVARTFGNTPAARASRGQMGMRMTVRMEPHVYTTCVHVALLMLSILTLPGDIGAMMPSSLQ